MKEQRTVLFIAYDFPPSPQRGGAIRSEKFVKYLGRHGWTAVVVSCSYKGFARPELFPNVHRASSLLPFESPYRVSPYGWIPALYQAGRRLLKQGQIDLLYVTCPPFPPSLGAVLLKRCSGLPLVVDFRDAWSLDPYSAKVSGINKLFHRHVFRPLERHVLRHADLFLTNTPSTHAEYGKLYPQLAARSKLLPNGFDEEDFTGITSAPGTGTMKLLYTGRFGVAARNPEFLLEALKTLIDQGLHLHFTILGDDRPELFAMRERLGLQNHLTLSGPVSHACALQTMAESDVLVLYQQDSDAKVTPVAGKTYEYLRIGKPILAIAPPGDNLELIRSYAVAYREITTYNMKDASSEIRSLYSLWKENKLNGNLKKIQDSYRKNYNRCELTRQLASYFDGLMQ